jgi:rhamnosyltransferase
MRGSKTAAIIVLYVPNETSLIKLLQSLSGAVDSIFVVDNTPVGLVKWVNPVWFAKQGFDVSLVELGENLGIAKAHNIGIELAIQGKCDHVILFDQDSEASPGMVGTLLAEEQLLLSQGVQVGSVGPAFIDQKTGAYAAAIKQGFFFINRIAIKPIDTQPISVDFLISSGSLIRVVVLQEVGVMLEKLFIDWVDVEWALRATSMNNYKHFMLPKAVMYHNIGDDLLNVGVRQINIHSNIRKYYIIRNACYLTANTKMKFKWRVNTALKIPAYWLVYLISSKNKLILIKLLFQAMRDGLAGRLGKAA